MNELKGEYLDFIGSYSNALSDKFCEKAIKQFDNQAHKGIELSCGADEYNDGMISRYDWSLDLSMIDAEFGDYGSTLSSYLNMKLKNNLDEYTKVFGHLSKVDLISTYQKFQKTVTGGGYHVWHDEQTSPFYYTSLRVLAWMVYLNDDYEGGETEFLYYKNRIKGKKGSLLIWPAGMTHVHRGGLVLSGNKYIITGWFHVI